MEPDRNVSKGSPAVAEVLIGLFLDYHKTSELVMCKLSIGYGSEVCTTEMTNIRCFPGVFNIEHHENLPNDQ